VCWLSSGVETGEKKGVQGALREVTGAYAIAVICEGDPDVLVAARKGSPLMVGVGSGECIVASDPSAIVAHTTQAITLDDYSVCKITRDGFRTTTLDNVELTPKVIQLEMDLEQIEGPPSELWARGRLEALGAGRRVAIVGTRSPTPYGLEQIVALAQEKNIKLAVLPGDAKPDAGLLAHCTLSQSETQLLWGYLTEGGPENMEGFLRACAHLIGDGEAPPAPKPLLKSGLYWPGMATPSLGDIKSHWHRDAPVAAITFYRALIEGANTAPVDAMIKEIGRAHV